MFENFDKNRADFAIESLNIFLKIIVTLFAGLIVAILSMLAFLGSAEESDNLVKNLIGVIPIFVQGLAVTILSLTFIVMFKFSLAFNSDKKSYILFCILALISLLAVTMYVAYSHGLIEGIISISGIESSCQT